jgi:hypothetical protein
MRCSCIVPDDASHRRECAAPRRGHEAVPDLPSLRANGSRECAPDDRLREAIHSAASGQVDCFRLRAEALRRTRTLRSLRSKRRRVAALAMTWKHTCPFPRQVFARVVAASCPSFEQRAQGKPGADCARSPRATKSTGVELQVQPNNPGFPRATVLRLISCSPR